MAAVATAALAGCATIVGIDDWEASSSPGGGGGGASVSASAGGGGGGGEGAKPVEICDNGVDDDSDSLVDCEDIPECSAYTCTPDAPPGWTGPATLAVDRPCDRSWPAAGPAGGIGFSVGASSCACACSAPVGQACSTGGVILYSSAGCVAAQAVYAGLLPAGICTNIPDVGVMSVLGGYLGVAGGSCAPVPTIDLPAPTFAHQGAVCQPAHAGAACRGGSCTPSPPPVSGACVFAMGQLDCPARYPHQTLLYGGTEDTRGCTACSCGAPAGSFCQGATYLYADSACAAQYGPISNDGSCVSFTGIAPMGSLLVVATSAPLGGACAASGSSPTGAAVPTAPVTVCCTEPTLR